MMHSTRVSPGRMALLVTLGAVVAGLLPAAAGAQQTRAPAATAPQSTPPARDIPRPDQLEPGVTTTPAAADPGTRGPDSGTSPASTPRATAAVAPASAASASSAPPATGASRKEEPPAAKATPRKAGPDRIELDTTDITGNRELPKVLYIVPWKRSDLGDLVGKPVNSLLDEVLQPLDRDVFQRENRYYNALQPGQDGAKTGAAQGSATKP